MRRAVARLRLDATPRWLARRAFAARQQHRLRVFVGRWRASARGVSSRCAGGAGDGGVHLFHVRRALTALRFNGLRAPLLRSGDALRRRRDYMRGFARWRLRAAAGRRLLNTQRAAAVRRWESHARARWAARAAADQEAYSATRHALRRRWRDLVAACAARREPPERRERRLALTAAVAVRLRGGGFARWCVEWAASRREALRTARAAGHRRLSALLRATASWCAATAVSTVQQRRMALAGVSARLRAARDGRRAIGEWRDAARAARRRRAVPRAVAMRHVRAWRSWRLAAARHVTIRAPQ